MEHLNGHLTERQKKEDEYYNTLNFEYFDPERDIIKAGIKNATITLVGARRRGKSILIRDLYYKIGKHYTKVYLFSGTAEAQGSFWDFIPKKNIFYGVDETKLEKIWEEQGREIENSKETDKTKMPHVMIIFDDVINTNSGVRNSDFICKLYSNGRHYNILSILATQSYKKVSKHARDNTDISIAYSFKNTDDTDDFVKENFSVDSARLGRKIFDGITGNGDYHSIVVLSYLQSKDITKTIKKYLADPSPKMIKEPRKVKTTEKINGLYSNSKVNSGRYNFYSSDEE